MQRLQQLLCATSVALYLSAAGLANDSTTIEQPVAAVASSRGLVAEQPASGPYVPTERGFMVPYVETIPGTDVQFEMIPVPGGVFTFGSQLPEDERGEFELPPVQVELPAFWIGKTEVTWEAYWKYMELNDDFAKIQALRSMTKSNDAAKAAAAATIISKLPRLAQALAEEATLVDGVTAPTALYDPSTTYESGEDPQLPAVTMTPYAAKQYTKWLSSITGLSYRLPTEAEWEYAARAGSTTVYPFGDDPDALDDYAWYEDNSDYVTHPVGEKQPNAWGLHDMLGNVAEWVIDEYREELERPTGATLTWAQAIQWPTNNHSRIARGGFFDSPAEECRSSSRFYSEDEDWKASDPILPLSPWWYTEYPSTGVGMRLVRPLEPMSPELAEKFWEIDSEETASVVAHRLKEGRGKLGKVGPNLPHVSRELEQEVLSQLLEAEK